MTSIEVELMDKLVLNENAYFYVEQRSLSRNAVEQLFLEVSRNKMGNRYKAKIIREVVVNGLNSFTYSLCIFQYRHRPSFLTEDIDDWFELKFSFLLIVEHKEFIIIQKRNVSGLKPLNRFIEPIDYSTIAHMLVGSSTTFEKISVSNMNTADNAIRNKTMESNNLMGTISPLEASKKTIHNMRLDNSGIKTSLSLNTSRINYVNHKRAFPQLLNWIGNVCEIIDSSTQGNSFLDNFSTPIKYSDHRNSLVPISVLLKFDHLKKEIEDGKIERIYEKDNEDVDFDVFQVIGQFDTLCELTRTTGGLSAEYLVSNAFDPDMKIRLNEKSIRIYSDRFKDIMIDRGENRASTLIDNMNWRQEFIVNFEQPDLVYSFKKLFRDHRLLDSIESFMSVFVGVPGLQTVTSEKGDTAIAGAFDPNSIFGLIETSLGGHANFLICDDLENEWADLIGITDDSITFYHAKYKSGIGLSGSNLHVIVAQAQKNLGNLDPTEEVLNAKNGKWSGNYPDFGISRLRNGGTSNEAIDAFIKTLSRPNRKKRVELVINYISKQELNSSLLLLKNGTPFVRSREVTQILWLVSSLTASCIELGIELLVQCSP